MASKSSAVPENHLKPWLATDLKNLHQAFADPSKTNDVLANTFKRNFGAIKAQREKYGKQLLDQGIPEDVIIAKCQLTINEINNPASSPHGKSIIDKKRDSKQSKKEASNSQDKQDKQVNNQDKQIKIDAEIVDPNANTIEDMDETEIVASLGINKPKNTHSEDSLLSTMLILIQKIDELNKNIEKLHK